VLIATADPLSYIPSLGARDSAWLSVNLLASDLTTSGFAPQYGVFDFNLPPKMTSQQFTDYWRSFHSECRRLGLAIIGGHTGRYPGCDYTVIGGGVMYAIGGEERYLTSRMGEAGDEVVLTKGAAIETTAVLARSFPKAVRRGIGANLCAKASGYLHQVSTVKDSLTAVSVGVHQNGVTAMHDATEGGVMAAAIELAQASGLGVELDLSAIPISTETNEICRLFRINPLTSLSEGSLIIACRPTRVGRLTAKLRGARLTSNVIGRLTRKRVFRGVDSTGTKRTLRYPKFDPYWRAYWKATSKHWK
jgi:hydrogenase maturation factor